MVKKSVPGVRILVENEEYGRFMHGTTDSEKRVMLAILKVMGKDTNLFVAGGSVRDEIMELANVSEQTFKNAMVRFRQMGFLISTHSGIRGEHQVSILFAVKGDYGRVWNVGRDIEERLTGIAHQAMVPTSIDGEDAALTKEDLAKVGAMAKRKGFVY